MREGTGQAAAAAPADPSAWLGRGLDAMEAAVLGGDARERPARGEPLTPELLDDLRATTEHLAVGNRRLGSVSVLAEAAEHTRALVPLLSGEPGRGHLRTRLLLAAGEAALLNAFLAQDADVVAVGERWARLATTLGHLAGASDLAGTAVALQAKFLVDRSDARTALGVLRQLDVARPSARIRAYALVQQAIAHATLGRSYETMATLDRGEAELETSAGQPSSWWVPMRPGSGMLCGHAVSYLRLKQAERAFEVLDAGRVTWPESAARGKGELLTDLGKAALMLGEVELACAHATAALQIARDTGSRRQLRFLRAFAQDLEPHTAVPAAPELRAQFGLG